MIRRWFVLFLLGTLLVTCTLPGPSSLHVLSPIDSFAHEITFSPDGTLLAIGTLHDGAHLWRMTDKTFAMSFGSGDMRTVAFSPDGQVLVTGNAGETGTVRLWSVATGTLIRTLDPTLTSWIQSVAFSPDGTLLAVGTSTHVHLFDTTHGSLHHTFDGSGMQVRFSPDGHQLAVAENLPVIHIYQLGSYEEQYTLPGHRFSIAYSPNGTLFASPGWNNQGMITFSGAEHYATTVGGENEVQLWNITTGTAVRSMNTHGAQVHALAFSPDTAYLVSGGNDTVILTRVTDGHEVARLKLDRGIDSLAFSPDGTMVVIGIYKTLYWWSVQDILSTPTP